MRVFFWASNRIFAEQPEPNVPLVLARMVARTRDEIAAAMDPQSGYRKAITDLSGRLSNRQTDTVEFITTAIPPRGIRIHKLGVSSRPGIEVIGQQSLDSDRPSVLFLSLGGIAMLFLGFLSMYGIWKESLHREVNTNNRAVQMVLDRLRAIGHGGGAVEVFRARVDGAIGERDVRELLTTVWMYSEKGVWIGYGPHVPSYGFALPSEDAEAMLGILTLLYCVDNGYFNWQAT